MNSQHYDIAYEKLIDYLMHFCVSRIYGSENATQQQPRTFGGHTGFVSLELDGDPTLKEGDLVLLSGHKQPKWRMGWFIKSKGHEYLVQSVMGEGEQTWMTNISVAYFHRPTLQTHPEWRWTNEQHQFADAWMTLVSGNRDTQMLVPMMPVFLGDSVTLKARARFGIEEHKQFKPSITISDFRQLGEHELLHCYDELCQSYDTYRATRSVVHMPARSVQ